VGGLVLVLCSHGCSQLLLVLLLDEGCCCVD
jgi:hypothetical protein